MRYIVPIMLLFVSSMTYCSQRSNQQSTKPPGKAPGELTIVAAVLHTAKPSHPTSPPRAPREKSAGKDTEPRTGKAPGEHHDHLQRRGSNDCVTDPPPRTVSPQHRPGGDCQTEPPKGKASSPQPQLQPAQMLTGADALGLDAKRSLLSSTPPIVA